MNQETEEEPILQTIAEPLQQVLQQAAALALKKDTKSPAKTLPFRPSNRQPLATLTILNDESREEGETVYIRNSRIVIGREKGDVTIPFDVDISGQHAELRCQRHKGKFRWYLRDLSSTNGTFVRGFRASLSRETELMIGSRRYLFQLPNHLDDRDETQPLQTQAFQSPSPTMMENFQPRLVETGTKKKSAHSFSIAGNEASIGGNADCEIVIDNDPFLSPQHARLYQDERGRWMIDDRKSLNGVWIRIKRMALDQKAEFQLGQQRFRFQPNQT